eukprot:Skav235072  [mRNA]  locus=scaffold3466:131994:145576:- [translate_table: standard]
MLAAKIIFHCIDELISIGSAEAGDRGHHIVMAEPRRSCILRHGLDDGDHVFERQPDVTAGIGMPAAVGPLMSFACRGQSDMGVDCTRPLMSFACRGQSDMGVDCTRPLMSFACRGQSDMGVDCTRPLMSFACRGQSDMGVDCTRPLMSFACRGQSDMGVDCTRPLMSFACHGQLDIGPLMSFACHGQLDIGPLMSFACHGQSDMGVDAFGLLKTAWFHPGLRQIAEETLLSGARLVRAFANVDRNLRAEAQRAELSAGETSSARATSAKCKAEPARSRSPRRDRCEEDRRGRARSLTPLPRSSRREPERLPTGDTEESEGDDFEEGEEEEEEPPEPSKRDRRPPLPAGPPPAEKKKKKKKSSGKTRRGGAKHQRHWREAADPLRRSGLRPPWEDGEDQDGDEPERRVPTWPQSFSLDGADFWSHRHLPLGSIISFDINNSQGFPDGKVAVLVEKTEHEPVVGMMIEVKLVGVERSSSKARIQKVFGQGRKVHLCFAPGSCVIEDDGNIHVGEFFWHPPGTCDLPWLTKAAQKEVKKIAEEGGRAGPKGDTAPLPANEEDTGLTGVEKRLGALRRRHGPQVTFATGTKPPSKGDGKRPTPRAGPLSAFNSGSVQARPKMRVKQEAIVIDSDEEGPGTRSKKKAMGAVLALAADTRQKQEAKSPQKRSRSRGRKKKKKRKRGKGSPSGSDSQESDDYSSEEMVAPLKKRSKREPGSVFAMLERQAIEHLAQDGMIEEEDPHSSAKVRMYTYYQLGLRPLLDVRGRDSKEISMLAKSLDLLKEGRLAELADVLASRLVAVNTAATQGWNVARHLEIHHPEEDGPVPPHVLLQAQRHSRRVEKAGGKGSWSRGGWSWEWSTGSSEKGKGKSPKGKGKKGKSKGKNFGNWSGNEKEKELDPKEPSQSLEDGRSLKGSAGFIPCAPVDFAGLLQWAAQCKSFLQLGIVLAWGLREGLLFNSPGAEPSRPSERKKRTGELFPLPAPILQVNDTWCWKTLQAPDPAFGVSCWVAVACAALNSYYGCRDLGFSRKGGAIDVIPFLRGHTKFLMENPMECLLPEDERPSVRLQAKVHIKPGEELKVFQLLHERGVIGWYPADTVFTTPNGPCLNGLFGVVKPHKLAEDGSPVLRCIMNLIPANSLLRTIVGDVQFLPNATAWLPLVLAPQETLGLSQGDMSAAFYLFSCPECWIPFMHFNYEVDGHLINREPGASFRPVCRVLPMGWHSSVGVMQQISREILLSKGLPQELELHKLRHLPPWFAKVVAAADDQHAWWQVYLDNFMSGERSAGDERVLNRALQSHAMEAWRSSGVLTAKDKEVVNEQVAVELGVRLDGPQGLLGCSAERVFKTVLASLRLLQVASPGRKLIQVVLGRWVFILQYRRAGGFTMVAIPQQLRLRSSCQPTVSLMPGNLPRVLLAGRTVSDRRRLRKGISRDYVITEKTRKRYAAAVATILPFLEAQQDLSDIDDIVCDWIELQWTRGEALSVIGDALSGLHHFWRELRGRLRNSWRLFRSWRRIETPCRAPPLTCDLCKAFVSRAVQIDCIALASLIALGFHGLLRTGELLALRFADLEVNDHCGIVSLHCSKSGLRTGAQEAIATKDSLTLQLLQTLITMNAQGPGAKLWSFSPQRFRTLFRSLCDAEGLLLVTRALTSINSRKEGDRLARTLLLGRFGKAPGRLLHRISPMLDGYAVKVVRGTALAEAKALLAIAEVNADQRGSKKRDEARAAGKDAYELFTQLGDVRGQAAALLVQSHVAIKSKNQEGPGLQLGVGGMGP